MRIAALFALLIAALTAVACTGNQPTDTPAPIATPTPAVTPRPTDTPDPTATEQPERIRKLAQYAEAHANGPGAIYVGDLSQLAGPAVTDDLGDDDGNVPLDAILEHTWIFESDYYQSLLEKARLSNPTELVSSGKRITLQHTCINRVLLWCELLEAYFVPNVESRTTGQVTIEVSFFPELGLAGHDADVLLADGTLSMAEIYGGYFVYEYPILAMQFLWGLWPDRQTHYEVQVNLFDDIEKVIKNETGATVLFHNWSAGYDQFFFSNKKLETPEDFKGLKTFSYSYELRDWINGMGASARRPDYSDAHTALDRGILDAGVTGANSGYGQQWYEVTDYMNGPLYSFDSTTNAINGDVWDSIPPDIQQILIEEGAKHELEALRLAAIQSIMGVQRNIEAGLEFVEFSPGIHQMSFRAARENVLPNWLRALGYPGYGQETVDVFNAGIGPYVGLYIQPDGSVVKVPITEGPHAGKTMEQVLAE